MLWQSPFAAGLFVRSMKSVLIIHRRVRVGWTADKAVMSSSVAGSTTEKAMPAAVGLRLGIWAGSKTLA